MLKFALIIVLAVVALVLIKLKSEYRTHITAGFIICIIILNIAYDIKLQDAYMKPVRAVNQLNYQGSFAETLEYPDALLPLALKDKKVHVINDAEKIDGFWWQPKRYHYYNAVNYIEYCNAEVINDIPEGFVISEGERNKFKDLGYANDMFRNTCIFADRNNLDEGQEINYFGFYWWYNEHCDAMHIYVSDEDLSDKDELVWIWHMTNNNESEDTYVMSYDYYMDNIK